MTANAAGLVTATHRRHYAVRLDNGETVACILRGRSLSIACGDLVEVERSPSNEGTIVSVAPRTTLFFRSDIQRDKLLAANVTQVLGFVAPDPPYDDELVHRWIIAAESNDCRFVLIANKEDLPAFALIADRLAQFA
jgi:ribosome biogenesis GTPase / thiamine phosphate phosphatase